MWKGSTSALEWRSIIFFNKMTALIITTVKVFEILHTIVHFLLLSAVALVAIIQGIDLIGMENIFHNFVQFFLWIFLCLVGMVFVALIASMVPGVMIYLAILKVIFTHMWILYFLSVNFLLYRKTWTCFINILSLAFPY